MRSKHDGYNATVYLRSFSPAVGLRGVDMGVHEGRSQVFEHLNSTMVFETQLGEKLKEHIAEKIMRQGPIWSPSELWHRQYYELRCAYRKYGTDTAYLYEVYLYTTNDTPSRRSDATMLWIVSPSQLKPFNLRRTTTWLNR